MKRGLLSLLVATFVGVPSLVASAQTMTEYIIIVALSQSDFGEGSTAKGTYNDKKFGPVVLSCTSTGKNSAPKCTAKAKKGGTDLPSDVVSHSLKKAKSQFVVRVGKHARVKVKLKGKKK